MKKNKIQVILPDALIEKFDRQAKQQSRSYSNLARLYIVDGLLKDEVKKMFNDPILINGADEVYSIKSITT